jgi:hypothetical protein
MEEPLIFSPKKEIKAEIKNEIRERIRGLNDPILCFENPLKKIPPIFLAENFRGEKIPPIFFLHFFWGIFFEVKN